MSEGSYVDRFLRLEEAVLGWFWWLQNVACKGVEGHEHLRVHDNSGLPFLEIRAVSVEFRDVVGVGNVNNGDVGRVLG